MMADALAEAKVPVVVHPTMQRPGSLETYQSQLCNAAVLVPLVERDTGLTVLLTRRSDSLKRHSGQVAFPGGKADPGEAPVDTALRETWEEIGLDGAFIRPLGVADTYETGTGFAITPVVALVRPGFTLLRHEVEVAEIFETPFEPLSCNLAQVFGPTYKRKKAPNPTGRTSSAQWSDGPGFAKAPFGTSLAQAKK